MLEIFLIIQTSTKHCSGEMLIVHYFSSIRNYTEFYMFCKKKKKNGGKRRKKNKSEQACIIRDFQFGLRYKFIRY